MQCDKKYKSGIKVAGGKRLFQYLCCIRISALWLDKSVNGSSSVFGSPWVKATATVHCCSHNCFLQVFVLCCF